MPPLSRLSLADTTGDGLTASALVIGVKFGINRTPLCTSCDAGVEVLEPVTNIFRGFGLRTQASLQ